MATDVETMIFERCARCGHGQKMTGSRRLCDYGVSAIPVESMRHPLGQCGVDATKFIPAQQPAETAK